MVYVERLIEEIAGQNKVLLEHIEIRGGRKVPRTMRTMRASKPATDQEYYVLLVDCGGDDLVKTRIIEEHQNLTNKGYAKIIGLRDVRPKANDFSVALVGEVLVLFYYSRLY